MPRIRIPITLGDWKVLTETVTPETRQGRAYLEHAHAKLEGFLAEVLRLTTERADHQAKKQEATRRINEIVDEGRRLASSLRQALKEELGPESEELARYGIQPFRGGKSRKPKSLPTKKPAETAAASPESSEIPET
jgi:hypothetical protein